MSDGRPVSQGVCPSLWPRTRGSDANPAYLKGQCHDIFCFWFFSWISSPKLLSIPLGPFRIFFEKSRRYSQLKVDHRYQRHRRQIWPPVSLVLLIPVANLPPVSTILAANLPLASLTPIGLISGCRYLKVNLKAKMYICVNSTIHRCPKKINKIFLIEDFSHLPPVSTTEVVKPWAANITANFQKNSKWS